MEIIGMKKNCLGTMDFTLRIGKMRKAESFITYPVQKDDDGSVIHLQSHHRWAVLNTRTGEIEMSARRAQYANSAWLMVCRVNKTTEHDKATAEQLEQMLVAVRGTASPMAGGDNALSIYCDNSNAALV